LSELERKLLGCLSTPEQIAAVWEAGLRPEAFEDPVCRRVYAFVIDYWVANQAAPTDYVLAQEVPGFSRPAEVEEATAWLAERLQRRYVINQLQEMLRQAATTAMDDPVGTLRTLYQRSYDAAEAVAPRLGRSDMRDPEGRRRRYFERQQRPGGIGLPLGIEELDAHTGGVMPGELVALGGFAKTGKTFFLVNAAVNLRKAGYLPILFTLEMSVAEVEDRIDAMYSGVSYARLVHGQLTLDEAKALRAAQDDLAERGGILVESPDTGDRTVASMINRARRAGADFVLIDQLSHMEAGYRTRDLKEHHGAVMKQLSTEISRPGKELPCMIAVQLRRPESGASTTAAQTIELHHFANAAEIEREVDLALGLTRTAEERRNNMMQLHILGARRSDTRRWALEWQLSECSRIRALQEMS